MMEASAINPPRPRRRGRPETRAGRFLGDVLARECVGVDDMPTGLLAECQTPNSTITKQLADAVVLVGTAICNVALSFPGRVHASNRRAPAPHCARLGETAC